MGNGRQTFNSVKAQDSCMIQGAGEGWLKGVRYPQISTANSVCACVCVCLCARACTCVCGEGGQGMQVGFHNTCGKLNVNAELFISDREVQGKCLL